MSAWLELAGILVPVVIVLVLHAITTRKGR